MNIEFVSYDGEWPSLCMGRLILKVNGEEIDFGKYCLQEIKNSPVPQAGSKISNFDDLFRYLNNSENK